jgi:hypothetical protein
MQADGLLLPSPIARRTKWLDEDVDQPYRCQDFNESFDRIKQFHHNVELAKSLPMEKSHVSYEIPMAAIRQERIYYRKTLFFLAEKGGAI